MNSYKDKEHAKKFYHIIMYSDLPEESITKTRVCMYQKQCFFMDAMHEPEYDYT